MTDAFLAKMESDRKFFFDETACTEFSRIREALASEGLSSTVLTWFPPNEDGPWLCPRNIGYLTKQWGLRVSGVVDLVDGKLRRGLRIGMPTPPYYFDALAEMRDLN